MTPRQELFVKEYLVDLNATKAAVRAGYSAKTAEQQGPRLLGNVGVAVAIKKALEARAERVEVKSDDVLRELLRLARVDLGDAFDDKGKLKALHEMSVDVRRAISGIKVTTEGRGDDAEEVLEVKFWPKVQALELLGKHLGLFPNKVEHAADEALTVVINSLAEPKKGKKP